MEEMRLRELIERRGGNVPFSLLSSTQIKELPNLGIEGVVGVRNLFSRVREEVVIDGAKYVRFEFTTKTGEKRTVFVRQNEYNAMRRNARSDFHRRERSNKQGNLFSDYGLNIVRPLRKEGRRISREISEIYNRAIEAKERGGEVPFY